MLDIDSAYAELAAKSYAQIQRETAFTWASRAIVYWRLLRESTPTINNVVKYTRLAEEFEHEAREHAALVDDGCVTLNEIQTALRNER
jgi:hypothetical protein